MVWQNILKEDSLDDLDDFMDLGNDHHEVVSQLLEDLAKKIIEEESRKLNISLADLTNEQFQDIMEEAMEAATPMVTERFVSRLRHMQNRIRREHQ